MRNKKRIIIYSPMDTIDALGFNNNDYKSLLKNINNNEHYNLNLLINKFAIFDIESRVNGDKEEYAKVKPNIQYKYEVIRNKSWENSFKYSKKLYINKLNNIIEAYKQQNINIKKARYKLDWRLAVGLGEISVYETSIKLHHIYGFPYIPASTFKGSIRSWVINNYFKGKEENALKDGFFLYVFGSAKSEKSEESEERQGNVVFFDVFPITIPNIELDIINTHHPDYYKDGMSSPPGDYDNPSLVNFLTVKGATFEFVYGYNNIYKVMNFKNTKFSGEPDKIISGWIDDALNYQGIGAKTSVGYGYFSKIN